MSTSSNRITTVSVIVAVVCAGWAIYATKHAGRPADGPPPGMGAPARPAGPSAGASPGAAASARPGAPSAGGAPGAGGMPVAVVTQEVRSQRLTQRLEALGTARANEAVEISSKASNVVSAVRFRDGQRVARGAVLVELDSAQARADLAEAQAALTESQSQFDRSRDLVATQALSKSQYDQIEASLRANQAKVAAARARLEDTVIRAPFDGRVGLRKVSVGSFIAPGAVITTLDDTSVIKLDFAVPENFLATLREGLSLTARTAAYPDREFSGQVTSIDSRVDERSRAVTVRAILPNRDGHLKPGMFMNVELAKDTRDALVIPEEALVPEQNRQYVFVVADGMASRREVRIGRREPGSVEVVQGLTAGERVITEGTQKARDGAPVRDLAAQTEGGAAPAVREARN